MRVLVLGASGLVGHAAAAAFAADGHEVVAASRRPIDPADPRITHVSLDLMDADRCARILATVAPISHVVYAAVHELPGLVAGWKSREQMQTNLSMFANVLETPAVQGSLRHVTALQGTKAYGVHFHPIRVPARESEPRDDHPNFYWLQEDHLRDLAARHGFGWTILRPPLIVGSAVGSAMNLPPVLAAYAAIRSHEGLPFSYPGGPSYVADAVDARIVAQACVWAAKTPTAHNRHFNITNGDVYQWRDLWPQLADALAVPTGPDEPVELATYLTSRASTWDEIVHRHRLRPLTLPELLGQSHHYADFQLIPRARKAPPPALLSTVEIRRAGFSPAMHTVDSFTDALTALQRGRFVPASLGR